MVLGMAVFAAAGVSLVGPYGLLGVAGASIAGQFAYWAWMVMAFRRASDGLRLWPGRADFADLLRILRETMRSMWGRLFPRAAVR